MSRSRPVLVGALGLLLGVVTACSAGPADLDADAADPAGSGTPVPSAAATAPAPAAAPGLQQPTDPLPVGAAPRDVVTGLQRALQERAVAVLTGDEATFSGGLAPDDAAFAAVQQVWFANLRQLPLQVFSLTPDPATVVRTGPGAYAVNVEVTMQLQGFDAAPVTTLDRYGFEAGRRGGRLRLASTTDAEWEARNGVQTPPWETTPLVVRAAPGVLGLFDARGEGAAAPLVSAVQESIAAVSSQVPYPWAQSVVVVALSDDAYLRSLPDLHGADPEDPDAVAFDVSSEVVASADAPATTVATRLALSPRLLGRDGPGRDRLLRHELTHVAVASRDDHAPLWLSEGLAEMVSVRSDPTGRQRVQPEALAAARAGVTELPAQVGFHDDDVAEHYGVSWWACEYVAATAGPSGPWALLEQLEALGAQSPLGVADAAQQDAVLGSVVGVNSRTLARKAGKLMLAAVAPAPEPVPTPAPVVPPGPVPSTS